MKFIKLPLLSVSILSSLATAATFNLDLPAAGTYTPSTTVTTSLSSGGATFDVEYTVTASATGANPFVSSNGTLIGVGSDADIIQHYNTLEGDDNEVLSFSALTFTNFDPGTSGLTAADFTNTSFSGMTFGSAENNQDGVDVTIGGTPVNYNLSDTSTLDITSLSNYTDPTTAFSITNDNDFGTNRWSVNGLAVNIDIVPEPTSSALLGLGAFGLLVHRNRRN